MSDNREFHHLHNLRIDEIPPFCIWEGSIVRTKILSLVHALAAGQNARILDLGCGRAMMWRPILEACPNFELYGIDPSDSGIDSAKRNLDGLRAHIAKGDVRNFAGIFPEVENFDIITSHSVLEHVVPRDLYFPGIKKRLAKNGAAFISWGSDHFSQGFATNVRNIVSEWLAKMGVERYYAKKVDEAWALQSIATSGLHLHGRYFHSLVPMKKMYSRSEGVERHAAYQSWIDTEERLNRSTQADAQIAPFMDETLVVLTHDS